jgi:hypothetical protein
VDSTALVAAILGAAWGAMVARDLIRGRRWTAVGKAGIGSAGELNLVTLGNGSWLEHQVISVIGLALIIASAAAFGAGRRKQQRDVDGFHR